MLSETVQPSSVLPGSRSELGITPQWNGSSSAADTDRWTEAGARLRELLRSTGLDTTYNNVNASRAVERAARTCSFVDRHMVERGAVSGERLRVPLKRLTRSWFHRAGRANNARVLTARAASLIENASHNNEAVKHWTLTYRDPADSWTDKQALRQFLNRLRVWAKRRHAEVSYLWTAEMQDRGALHYHIVLVGLPFVPLGLVRSWWPHGSDQLRVREDLKAIAYILKYVRKAVWCETADDDARQLLHSIAHRRRHGGTRDVTSRPEQVNPLWEEAARYFGLTVSDTDWWESVARDTCTLLREGVEVWTGRLSLLKWRLYPFSTNYGSGSERSPTGLSGQITKMTATGTELYVSTSTGEIVYSRISSGSPEQTGSGSSSQWKR